MYSVSFTGYRPEKMPFPNEEHPLCLALKKRLREEIEKLVKDGADCFFTGMARGTDMWCAEIVLELKKTHENLKLTAIIPCRTQSNGWDVNDKLRYENILKCCQGVICASETYTKSCMMKRNKALVDCCDVLLAVFDGKKGGTANTVSYAQSKSRKIITISPK